MCVLADLDLAVNFARWLLCPTLSSASTRSAELRPAWHMMLQGHPGLAGKMALSEPHCGEGRIWTSLRRWVHGDLTEETEACKLH